ncbi:DUF6297 family protein [Nocardiopsis sp. LOL_012]|uniref:DUF6297 family protein n=1 Tax=Nocardiopsis sp. LOL_012 TaxID=3345409 RepID=UPI003A84EF85
MSAPAQDTERHGADRATADVLRLLRRHRRPPRPGDTAFAVYAVLFTAVLVLPPLAAFTAGTVGAPSAAWPEHHAASAGLALTAAALAALWASAREATVRGPLHLSAPVIDWVLRLPVDRAPLLAPELIRSVLFRASAGALAAPLAVAVAARTVLLPPIAPADLAAASAAGALLGVLSVAVGTLTATRAARAVERLRPWHAAAQALLLTAAALTWYALPPVPLWTPAAWSGPWGWAAQALAAPLGAPGTHPWAALTLLGSATALLLTCAHRSLPLVSSAELRAGSAVTDGLRAGLWLHDPGWLHEALLRRRRDGGRLPFRVRPPRRARLLVPWRDLLGALRAPYTVAGALLLAAASALAVLAEPGPSAGAAAALALAPLAGLYAAASRLMAGARMDAADPRRARHLPPRSPGTLALAHGIWPLAATSAAAALPLLFLAGQGAAAPFDLLLALPALVAGALAGAYRGLMPGHLSFGVETPFGNTAPLQIASWHLSGPLGALAASWPTAPGIGLGAGWADLLWTAAGTAALVWWVRLRARRVR